MATLAADATEHFSHIVEQITVVDWLDELNVPEMTGTVNLRAKACLTKPVLVHGAHGTVIDTAGHRITILGVSLLLADTLVSDTKANDVFFGKHRESQAVYFVERHIRVFQLILHLYCLFT